MIEMEGLISPVSLQNDWLVSVGFAENRGELRDKFYNDSPIAMRLRLELEALNLANFPADSDGDLLITYPDVEKAALMFDERDNFCLVISFYSGRPFCIFYDHSKMELHKLQQNIMFASEVCCARQSFRDLATPESFLPSVYEVGDVLRHWTDNTIERSQSVYILTDLVSHWLRMHKRFKCRWNVATINMMSMLLDVLSVPSLEIYEFLTMCIDEWSGEEELKEFLENFLLKVLGQPFDIKTVPELSSLISYYMYKVANQSQGLDYQDAFVKSSFGKDFDDNTSAENLAIVCSNGLTCLYHNMTYSSPREVAIPSSVLETSTRLKVELETISGLNLFTADPTADILWLHDSGIRTRCDRPDVMAQHWADLRRQIGNFKMTDILADHFRGMPHGKRRYDYLTAIYFQTWDAILKCMGQEFVMVISHMLCSFPYYERALEEEVFAKCLVRLVCKYNLIVPLPPLLSRLLQHTIAENV